MSPLATTRRRFLAGTAAAGVAALAGDSFLLEPNDPRIVHREFFLSRWPQRLNGLTIALLSDFHYDPIFSCHPLHAAIPMVNGLLPDLIVLAGDYVTIPTSGNHAKAAATAEPCARLLSQMSAPMGLWAVLGNHDAGTDPRHVTHALEAQNIPVLANQARPIEREGSRFWIAGVRDVLYDSPNLSKTLQGIPSDEAVILLVHEPDFADEASKYPVDLQLSGHSHGGQIRLPFLPPLYLPPLAEKYYWGTYRVGPLALYTNAGLGTIGVAMRLNCPPEITLLTIRPASPGNARRS